MQVPLRYSKNDSQRFGLNIHRTPFAPEIDANKTIQYILENDVDIAFLRIPSAKLKDLQLLDRSGMPYMVADTLAYYHFDLLNNEVKPVENQDLEFRVATPNDHELLNQLVREIFGNYVNHYRVSYYFENEHVTEGYQDWVRSYAEEDPNRICWLVYKGGEIAGFGTFNFEKEEEKKKMKGILYGVLPKFRRSGLLRDMTRYALTYAKDRGCEYMRSTIQIENVAVQHCWTSEGFVFHHTVNTVHVNAMLSKSIFEPFSYQVKIENEEQTSPKVSNRHVLRRINKEFDMKQNIVTRNHRFVNIAPLKFGEEYILKFSYPSGSKGLLRITDLNHKTHMLVYFGLKHFVA